MSGTCGAIKAAGDGERITGDAGDPHFLVVDLNCKWRGQSGSTGDIDIGFGGVQVFVEGQRGKGGVSVSHIEHSTDTGIIKTSGCLGDANLDVVSGACS